MARTTKIPCEGAIYTVRRDAYGIVTEIDADASAEEPPESDGPMSEERARYAHVIQELTEFEEAIARAEALESRRLTKSKLETDELVVDLLERVIGAAARTSSTKVYPSALDNRRVSTVIRHIETIPQTTWDWTSWPQWQP